MKILHSILGMTFLFSSHAAFAQVEKKIVVEHFTNTNCSICGSRNPGFYTNLNSQNGVLHLAVHPSAPYASCLLYNQNATANDARTNYYGIYGSTPRLVINGVVILSSTNYASSSIFTPYQSSTTPASIHIVQQKFGADSIRSTITITTEATHSLGGLSLFVALAEDTVFYTGTNGEKQHYDVFRKSLSGTTGTSITLPAAVGSSVVLTFSSPSNSTWNFSRIYTFAMLQETNSKKLVQAEAVAPSANGTAGVAETHTTLVATIFPNPTTNIVNIQLAESAPAIVTIISLDGKVLMKKELSLSNSQLDLSSLPTATYLLSVKTDKGEYSQKIIKQ